MEESKTNDKSITQFPYPPPRGANKIYKCDTVFPSGEARKKAHSQTPIPYKIHKEKANRSFLISAPRREQSKGCRIGYPLCL